METVADAWILGWVVCKTYSRVAIFYGDVIIEARIQYIIYIYAYSTV